MHIFIALVVLILGYFKGDWRNLHKYGLTIFYIITCNLLYNLLCYDYLLWEYRPDLLKESHILVDLIYTFIILPAITLLYLGNYPFTLSLGRKLKYIIVWVIGSFLVTYFIYRTDRLEFHHGYKVWMDLLFYPVMYGMLRLHYTRPILTYGLSVIIILFLLKYFNVPIK
ncbi:CBO0543 family protein [Bacillus sp. PS06]|uniref:CBO0543 family protein n=1 Tax=Bacillus sp. PS06 TaxID=2764176 RepID=UPI00177FEF2C|nr:CBO0543 family protein [Bacillus sp. PS06]MBD8070618.1 hypothetical protein [Bacillus sp. PS06]